MISFTTPGVILRSRDVGTYDRMYSVYTRDRGKLSLRAISVRKSASKLQGSLNPDALLTLYIIAQRRFTLGGAVISESFPNITISLIAEWALQHIREVTDELTKPEHHDVHLFELLTSVYPELNHTDVTLTRALVGVAWFDMAFLDGLGLMPNLRTDEGRKAFIDQYSHGAKLSQTSADALMRLYQLPESRAWHTSHSLKESLGMYTGMRDVLLAHGCPQLLTDGLLKELIASKTLR